MKRKVMRNTLLQIIQQKRKAYAGLKGSENPCMKEIRSRIDAEINAFSAVLDALNENDVLLMVYFNGTIA